MLGAHPPDPLPEGEAPLWTPPLTPGLRPAPERRRREPPAGNHKGCPYSAGSGTLVGVIAMVGSAVVRVVLRGRWGSALAVLVIGALTLPIVGPLLDHHYAERVPGHLHLAGVSAAHTHPYEVDHRHAQGGAYTDASGAPLSEGGGYLLPQEEATGSSAGSGLTHLLLLALFALLVPPMLSLNAVRGPLWPGTFTPRMELPPPRFATA